VVHALFLIEEEARVFEPLLRSRIRRGFLLEHAHVAGQLLFEAGTIELQRRARHHRPSA